MTVVFPWEIGAFSWTRGKKKKEPPPLVLLARKPIPLPFNIAQEERKRMAQQVARTVVPWGKMILAFDTLPA